MKRMFIGVLVITLIISCSNAVEVSEIETVEVSEIETYDLSTTEGRYNELMRLYQKLDERNFAFESERFRFTQRIEIIRILENRELYFRGE